MFFTCDDSVFSAESVCEPFAEEVTYSVQKFCTAKFAVQT